MRCFWLLLLALMMAVAGCGGDETSLDLPEAKVSPVQAAMAKALRSGGAAAPASLTTSPPFNTTYDFSTDPMWDGTPGGDYGTGLALADINGDGYKDMVVASGNDKALQTVQVFYNDQTGHFPTKPSWNSNDTEHNALVAVGDIDGNGYLDVAVSIFLGPTNTYEGGGIKVYMNQGPPNYLEKDPSWKQTGFPCFGCDLGDADGDGDLDLLVAGGEPIPPSETFATQPCDNSSAKKWTGARAAASEEPPFETPGRIYQNNGGSFGSTPWWTSGDNIVAMTGMFADVNQDGFMDAVFQSAPVRVYLGHQNAPLSSLPDWVGTDTNYYGNGMDFAWSLHLPTSARPDTVPTIANSSNNYIGNGRGGFSLYRFLDPYIIQFAPRTSVPDWESKLGGWGSAVCLADVTVDGNLDMLTHRWNDPGRNDLNGTLLMYEGTDTMLTYEPTWQTVSTSVIESIKVSDLNWSNAQLLMETIEIAPLAKKHWLPGQTQQRVVYLPKQNVEGVYGVAINGTMLDPTEYAFVYGRNWVSVNRALGATDIVKVWYAWSPLPDVVYTNWNCDKGNYIYYSTVSK